MAVVLIVTRRLSVYLPPEIYMSRARASLEAEHLAHRLGREASAVTPEKLPTTIPSGNETLIHLIELPLVHAWAVTALWIGIERTDDLTLPSLTLITGDDAEAIAWFRTRVGTVEGIAMTSRFYESQIIRDGRDQYVGVHHLKQVGNL
jgi:hypothetical protein